MNEVDSFKLFSSLLIWVLALTGALAPLLVTHRMHPKVNSILNMVAAGIFLSGSCMHLLPDAQENEPLKYWMCANDGKDCFQWANFFYGCGFLLLLFMEAGAHSLERTFGKARGNHHERTPLILNTSKIRTRRLSRSTSLQSSLLSGASVSDHEADDYHLHHQLENGHNHHHPSYDTTIKKSSQTTQDSDSDETCVDVEVTHAHIHGIMDSSPILAFIVFTALSFHSIMEGMGVGASNRAAWDILIAILAHKSLAAFALALELIHHKIPMQRLLTTLALFSVMTPIGILVGWLLSDAKITSPVSGICAALAGGTFLFVAVAEIIPQELQNRKHLLLKATSLVVGYSAMSVISLWV